MLPKKRLCELQELHTVPLHHNVGAAVRATAILGQRDDGRALHLIVVLDASESMRARLPEAKAAVNCFYEQALTSRSPSSNSLFVFARDAQLHCLDGCGLPAVRQTVEGVLTRKGTNFAAVLSAIRRKVQEQEKGGNFFVVFFTDGRVFAFQRLLKILRLATLLALL